MAQRFPKWPHKSDGPFSCAAKRENHFSWIFAHLLLLLQSMYLYSFAMYVWKLSRNCGKTRRLFRHHKLVAESWKSRHMQNGNWCWLTQFLIFIFQKWKKFFNFDMWYFLDMMRACHNKTKHLIFFLGSFLMILQEAEKWSQIMIIHSRRELTDTIE